MGFPGAGESGGGGGEPDGTRPRPMDDAKALNEGRIGDEGSGLPRPRPTPDEGGCGWGWGWGGGGASAASGMESKRDGPPPPPRPRPLPPPPAPPKGEEVEKGRREWREEEEEAVKELGSFLPMAPLIWRFDDEIG